MRILAKVRVRPSGADLGPSNRTDVMLTSHHVPTSGLGTDYIRVGLNALVRAL